jgi:broad specificity phosphatase PhoE
MPTRAYTVIWKAVAVIAAAIVLGACSGTPHFRTITLTFVRHAESESNANDVLNTAVPGPGLTRDGKKQAQQLAQELERKHYDAVYASSMLRSQQTAAPLAQDLGEQVEVLPGLRELNAGWFNGRPTSWIDRTYKLAPLGWVRGDRKLAVPGSVDGNEFNERFTAAVRQIYDSGESKPVAFSHGMAIMAWTLMTVKNPKAELMTDHPLPNLGRVVITGSPAGGWTMVDWDGVRSFK